MKKKAIIIDLDNTIYPVSATTEKLFPELFRMLKNDGRFKGDLNDLKLAITRKPFHVVVSDFSFDPELKQVCFDYMSRLTYKEKIEPFPDYSVVRSLQIAKFLVTTGFTALQESKVEMLGIRNDFREIFIADPMISPLTKREIFGSIMGKYDLSPVDILIAGDDIDSEITAGKELGIDTVIYDYRKIYGNLVNENVITDFSELAEYL
jgi:putative hydrolase of the HAD superfamily